ncbi:MAG: alanine racemase [Acidobacteriota bacterium]
MPETAPALRRAWLEIDTGALARNFRRVAAAVAPARVLPVVKADAYGHGAGTVARVLEPEGAAGFAVALVEEGIELRRGGVTAPVLVLSPTPPGAEAAVLDHDLVPVVSAPGQLERIAAAAAAAGRRIAVHLKFDSGMTRLGFAAEEAGAVLERVRREPALELTGLLSHLAEAETPESPANARQIEVYRGLVGLLSTAERERVALHLANSAGALSIPGSRHGLVRIGLALYGVAPAGSSFALEPVMAVVSELAQVREVPPGTRAGYGGRWTASRPSRVGVVPVGYADGYPWRAEARASALVGGRRAPLAGAVSMDLVLLDLTDTGGEVGERVTLVGRDGGETIPAAELAAHAGTLVYEILCHFGLRLPRRAVSSGDAAGARDRQEAMAG